MSGYVFNARGIEENKVPVDFVIPDYRELDFANAGFMPFVFFNANSIKLKEEFEDIKDSENSQLVENISYTMSISRIAHYVKVMMKNRVGSNDD